MAPKCRASPPAGTQARITGLARSDFGGSRGPRLSFTDGPQLPGWLCRRVFGCVLLTFEPTSVFRFVPQCEVAAQSTGTSLRESVAVVAVCVLRRAPVASGITIGAISTTPTAGGEGQQTHFGTKSYFGVERASSASRSARRRRQERPDLLRACDRFDRGAERRRSAATTRAPSQDPSSVARSGASRRSKARTSAIVIIPRLAWFGRCCRGEVQVSASGTRISRRRRSDA